MKIVDDIMRKISKICSFAASICIVFSALSSPFAFDADMNGDLSASENAAHNAGAFVSNS